MNPKEIYYTLLSDATYLGGMPMMTRADAWEEGKLRARSDVARSILQAIRGTNDVSMWVLHSRISSGLSSWMHTEDIPRVDRMDFIFATLGSEAEAAAVEYSTCDLDDLEALSYELELASYANGLCDQLDAWKEAMTNLN